MKIPHRFIKLIMSSLEIVPALRYDINMNKNVIAIDGPAASGKGTLGRKIAAELNYSYLDTGKLYRAAALHLTQAGHDPGNEDHAIQASKALCETFESKEAMDEILQNDALSSDEIGSVASKLAAYESVRAVLLKLQQDFASQPASGTEGAVLDGRDIGTVICPDAAVKIFILADVTERAQRRHKELQSQGKDVTYEAVLEDMSARDARDTSRETAPLRPAEDAFILNTTHMGPDEVFEQAMAYIKTRLAA